MTDEADLPFGPPPAPMVVVPRKERRHRHVYDQRQYPFGLAAPHVEACRCGAIRDEAASRRGRNNRKRGLTIQRDRQAALGIENVPGNGPFDGRHPMFRSESKSGGAFPERLWRYLKGIPTTGETAILIVTDTPGPGHRARSVVIVDFDDWRELHG